MGADSGAPSDGRAGDTRGSWRAMADWALRRRGGDVRGSPSAAPVVLFVGAGPGGVGLLTLDALRALAEARVVLHDDLVSADVLDLIPPEALRLRVGKRAGRPSVAQGETNRLIALHAAAGGTVVRLKGGDPLVFGRLGEEIAVCRAAGIDYRIIPGISAAQAGAARLGIPLTGRGASRRLQFVTGQGADGRLPDDLNWAAIADPHATTALYMARRTLGEFVARARFAGLDPTIPAAALAAIGSADEALVRTTLGGLVDAVAGIDPRLPLVVLVGSVTAEGVAQAIAQLSEAA